MQSKKDEAASAERVRADDVAKSSLVSEKKALCAVLLREIDMRSDVLIGKCNLDVLESLSDYQILDFKKMMSEIDCELRELMDKVTEYSKMVTSCGGDVTGALLVPQKIQEQCLGSYLR